MRKVKTRKSVKKEDYEDLIYYKLKNSRFKQQRLPAWRPVPTLCTIIIFYVLFALIFIALGIVLIIFSNKIINQEIDYNALCIKSSTDNNACEVKYTISEDMYRPIMIYYKLDGFFQNHRRYVRSKSQKQLFGDNTTLEQMRDDGDCEPIYTNKDMGFEKGRKAADKETELNLDDVAIPCGLIAKTYFNDTFSKWKINDEDLEVNEKNIAWAKDKDLYKNSDISRQWIDVEDEHFIVWMRPAGLTNFKKLWGRIENRDLKKGDVLTIIVQNNYNVDNYEGNKKIILSTTNKFGGKNIFFGTSFIVVGAVSLLLGFAFPLLIYQRNKNEDIKKNI